jgi:hypothetical protein
VHSIFDPSSSIVSSHRNHGYPLCPFYAPPPTPNPQHNIITQAFKSTTTDDLLAPVLKAVVERSGVDPKALGDIVIGNVLQAGSGAVSAR